MKILKIWNYCKIFKTVAGSVQYFKHIICIVYLSKLSIVSTGFFLELSYQWYSNIFSHLKIELGKMFLNILKILNLLSNFSNIFILDLYTKLIYEFCKLIME